MQEFGAQVRRIDALTRCGTPDAPALIAGGETLTYAELEERVAALGAWLQEQGVAPGDRVATWLPKTVTACLVPLAAPRVGAVHVPVNPALKRGQVAYILADSGARLLVTQAARAGTLEAGDVPGGCDVLGEPELRSGRAVV